ncbi:MAG: hypothetical protein OEM21_05610, partial [Nitrosopumilus sp.]|nr:hypothetical protein [Nitrosopumilus sp.]
TRFMKIGIQNLSFAILGIVAIGVIYSAILPDIIISLISQDLTVKVVASVMILTPIGFLMGMPLPTGMRIMQSSLTSYIPWMWAINGAFSVLGATLTVIIGIIFGASYALLLGVSMYLVVLGISLNWKKKINLDIQN